jgi:hypothetical protein
MNPGDRVRHVRDLHEPDVLGTVLEVSPAVVAVSWDLLPDGIIRPGSRAGSQTLEVRDHVEVVP